MRRAQKQGTELDMESLDRNLAGIERQVDRMNGLVNDLLSVSRAEKGSLRMERVPYDLAVVLREVVQRYIDATLEEGRHTFTIDGPTTLPAHGDQSRVEQLFMNLVGNAERRDRHRRRWDRDPRRRSAEARPSLRSRQRACRHLRGDGRRPLRRAHRGRSACGIALPRERW
jgi:nitrogen fixation/metabolism regulation signal transduction histidine kinase